VKTEIVGWAAGPSQRVSIGTCEFWRIRDLDPDRSDPSEPGSESGGGDSGEGLSFLDGARPYDFCNLGTPALRPFGERNRFWCVQNGGD